MMKYVTKNDAIYYTDYDIIDSEGGFIKNFKEPDRTKMNWEEKHNELLRYYYGNGSTSLINRDVFDKIGLFDESLPYFEDYEFWLRASYNKIDLIHIPITTLKYRRHKDQMTNKVDISLADEIRSKYR